MTPCHKSKFGTVFLSLFPGDVALKKIGGFMTYTWSYFNDWINEALDTLDRELSPRWKRDDSESGWKVSFLLPGVKKEDVEVTSDHGIARIKYPKGTLRISLPRDVDHELLEAKLDLGIFELFAPDSKRSGSKTIRVK